jgi:hypothetical protein
VIIIVILAILAFLVYCLVGEEEEEKVNAEGRSEEEKLT